MSYIAGGCDDACRIDERHRGAEARSECLVRSGRTVDGGGQSEDEACAAVRHLVDRDQAGQCRVRATEIVNAERLKSRTNRALDNVPCVGRRDREN